MRGGAVCYNMLQQGTPYLIMDPPSGRSNACTFLCSFLSMKAVINSCHMRRLFEVCVSRCMARIYKYVLSSMKTRKQAVVRGRRYAEPCTWSERRADIGQQYTAAKSSSFRSISLLGRRSSPGSSTNKQTCYAFGGVSRIHPYLWA